MFLLRDRSVREHAVEHDVATLRAVLGIVLRIVVCRRLRDAHKRRRLRKRKVDRALGEIVLRRGLDAVASRPVVDRVQVHEQDVFFGIRLLHLDGELGFPHLAAKRDVVRLVREERVAHELLRDGGCALEAAALQVVHECASDAVVIYTFMLVEPGVLRRDRAFQHIVAHLVLLDGFLVLQIELRQKGGAVVRVDACLGAVGEGVRVVHAGQLADPCVHDASHAEGPEADDKDERKRRNEHSPCWSMGAHFTVFSPYSHDSSILP